MLTDLSPDFLSLERLVGAFSPPGSAPSKHTQENQPENCEGEDEDHQHLLLDHAGRAGFYTFNYQNHLSGRSQELHKHDDLGIPMVGLCGALGQAIVGWRHACPSCSGTGNPFSQGL